MKTLNLSGCTSLTELILTSATELTDLNVEKCTALTSLDISTLVNLEVFIASRSGIKTLSGDSACLDFSNNTKLMEIYVNHLTTFSTINLTQNTALQTFTYANMPMTSIDLSKCVALQNFQISGASVTSLDFTNCPELYRIILEDSSALTELNVSGCTKLYDVDLLNSDNVSTVNISNAGSAVSVGSYLEGQYLVFTVTSGSNTETNIQSASGWDSAVMSIVNSRS